MRIAALAALLALAASPALAQVQSYDAVCPGPCMALDGTTQPAGTVLYRFAWDGSSLYQPLDAAGVALSAVADPGQTRAIYQSVVPTAPAIPQPLTGLAMVGGHVVGLTAQGAASDPGAVPMAGDIGGTNTATLAPIQKPAYTTVTITSGGTVQLPSGFTYYDLSASGLIAAVTVRLPANPVDRQLARLIATGTLSITTLTVQDANGNAVGSTLGLGVLATALYQWQAAQWVRVGS